MSGSVTNPAMKTYLEGVSGNYKINLKDIEKCHSSYNGRNFVFFSQLSVLMKSGVWLDDTKIHKILKESTNVSSIYSKVLQEKLELEAGISGSSRVKRDLQKLDKSIPRIQTILNIVLPELLEKRDVPLENAQVQTKPPPPPKLSAEAKEQIQQKFKEKVEEDSRELAENKAGIEVKIDQNMESATQVLAKYVGELAAGVIGADETATVVAPVLTKLSGAKDLIGDAVHGLVDFAQQHMVASDEGLRIFRDLPPELRQNVERLAVVDKDIKKIEWELRQGYTEATKEEFRSVLDELKAEQTALREILAPLKEKIEADRVGNFFPIIHTNTLDAVHSHFSGLAKAVTSLRDEYVAFDQYSPNFKGMLINQKIQASQEQSGSNTLKVPLFVPTGEQLQEAGIDVNFLEELAKREQRLPDLESSLAEDEIAIQEMEKRGPVKAGWFTAGQSQEDFDLELSQMKADYNLRKRDLDQEKAFIDQNHSKFVEMDRDLGILMDKGSKVAELKFLAQVTDPIIDILLFPEGIQIGKLRKAILSSQDIEIDETGRQLLTEYLWSCVDYYGNPAYLNQQMETVIAAQLEAAKKPSAPVQTATPPSLFTEEQLLSTILEQELPLPDSKQTEKYKDLAFDLLAIGAPKVESALKAVTGIVDFGIAAKPAQRTVDGTVNALAMGFGNKDINSALVGFTNYMIPQEGSEPYVPPKARTPEEDTQTYENVREGIEELVRADISQLGGGWGSWFIPTTVTNTAVEGALQMFDMTQVKSVNRMLLLGVLAAVGNSIAETAAAER